MIAKVISHGENREVAIERLTLALSQLRCFGITTNQKYLQQILGHPDFISGNIDITWLEDQTWCKETIKSWQIAVAGLSFAFRGQIHQGHMDSFFTRCSYQCCRSTLPL